MSTEHNVELITVAGLTRHPNADTLSVTQVDGRPVIVRTGDFNVGDAAIYLPVDTLVPVADARFAFLAARGVDANGYHRVRATRLRGVFSMGLLIPASADVTQHAAGTEISSLLGTKVYEPGLNLGPGGDNERDPGYMPVYTDVESWRKWASKPGVLEPGLYYATEKIHGANARYCYVDGRIWCGSRTGIKAKDPHSIWWRAAEVGGLEEKLARLGDRYAVFGEVYGQVQDLKYNVGPGVRFAAFDVWDRVNGGYVDAVRCSDLLDGMDIPLVPRVGVLTVAPDGSYDAEKLREWSNGKSILGAGSCIREGIVIRPVHERYHMMLGRVILKLVGEDYMTRKGG